MRTQPAKASATDVCARLERGNFGPDVDRILRRNRIGTRTDDKQKLMTRIPSWVSAKHSWRDRNRAAADRQTGLTIMVNGAVLNNLRGYGRISPSPPPQIVLHKPHHEF